MTKTKAHENDKTVQAAGAVTKTEALGDKTRQPVRFSFEEQVRKAASEDWRERLDLASTQMIITVQKKLATDPNPMVRHALAASEHTHPAVLISLAEATKGEQHDEYVREHVRFNLHLRDMRMLDKRAQQLLRTETDQTKL